VLTTAEAVTIRSSGARLGDPGALTAAAHAAAQIGVVVLRAAEEAAQRGRDLVRAATGLEELPFVPPAHEGPAHDGPIRLR
jgi:hypothetical protein